MIEAPYDTAIEVSQTKYNQMRVIFAGICAFRTEGGKFWVKRLFPGYQKEVEFALNN